MQNFIITCWAERHIMEVFDLVIGVIALIPVVYLVYSRVIRKRHKIDFNIGNVGLARVISPNPSHNEKLAMVINGVTLVNSGPEPVTPKDIFLRYKFGRRFESSSDSVPTGTVQGEESVVMANNSTRIFIAWNNFRDELLKKRVLQQGETIAGCTVFYLDVSVAKYRDVSGFVLHVNDYSGRHSKHKLQISPAWYKGIEKGIALVDAPVREIDGIISWEGITIGKQSAQPSK
jgi:hypothetical protein